MFDFLGTLKEAEDLNPFEKHTQEERKHIDKRTEHLQADAARDRRVLWKLHKAHFEHGGIIYPQISDKDVYANPEGNHRKTVRPTKKDVQVPLTNPNDIPSGRITNTLKKWQRESLKDKKEDLEYLILHWRDKIEQSEDEMNELRRIDADMDTHFAELHSRFSDPNYDSYHLYESDRKRHITPPGPENITRAQKELYENLIEWKMGNFYDLKYTFPPGGPRG